MVSFTFVYWCDSKPQWSIDRTNCLYHSNKVDLYIVTRSYWSLLLKWYWALVHPVVFYQYCAYMPATMSKRKANFSICGCILIHSTKCSNMIHNKWFHLIVCQGLIVAGGDGRYITGFGWKTKCLVVLTSNQFCCYLRFRLRWNWWEIFYKNTRVNFIE